MAKGKKRKSTRRRRMGAAVGLNPKSPVMKIAAAAAGYLLADTINGAVDKVIPKKTGTTTDPSTGTTTTQQNPIVSDKILGVVQVGLGALLLMKGKPSLIKTAAGGLLAGSGAKRALKSFGVISGYQSVPVIGRRRIAGYQSVPVIGGRTPAQLQGVPAQLQGVQDDYPGGFRVNGYVSQGSGPGVMAGLYTDSGSGVNASDR